MTDTPSKLIRVSPRELADIQELSRRHVWSNPVVTRWNPDRTADLVDPPVWALEALAKMRSGDMTPSLKVKCPVCAADPGGWCVFRNKPKQNWLHSRRALEAWDCR